MSQHNTFCGFFSSLGCSAGLSVAADGFGVIHNASTGPDGAALKYNQSGVVYIYAYS